MVKHNTGMNSIAQSTERRLVHPNLHLLFRGGGAAGGAGGRYRGLLTGHIRMRVAPCLGCQAVRHLRETKANEVKVGHNKHVW